MGTDSNLTKLTSCASHSPCKLLANWFVGELSRYWKNLSVLMNFVKMSVNKLALCNCIVNDYYGEIVGKVAMCLAQNGLSSCRAISRKTNLSFKEVSDIVSYISVHAHATRESD